MREARFRLESLLQFADQLVDLITLELSALERRQAATQEALESCRQEQTAVLNRVASGCPPAPAVLVAAYAYLDRLEKKAAELCGSIAELEAAIARKRDELLAAEKERRMLLKLKEEFEAALRAGLARRHQQFLDDLAGSRHFRRRSER